jgi:preprotein translocase subunit SecA
VASRATRVNVSAARGTDIKLRADVIAAGSLHVILTKFHESARIDRQLFGRCAQQGNPGSVEAIVSLEDEPFPRFVEPRLRAVAGFLLRLRQGQRPDRCSLRLGELLRSAAQRNAERMHARTRRETVEQDRRYDKSLAFAGKSE